MLRKNHLIIVYLHLISIGVIVLSHWSNVSTMKAIIAYVSTHKSISIPDDYLYFNTKYMLSEGPRFVIIQNYILQCVLAGIFCYTHLAPKDPILQKLLVLSFMAPSILGIYPLPVS